MEKCDFRNALERLLIFYYKGGLHVNTVKCKMEKCDFRNALERLLIFYYKGWEKNESEKED